MKVLRLKLNEYYKNIDIFGQKVELYIDKQTVVKSNFGASLTIILFLICSYLLAENFIVWAHTENLQIISSSLEYNIGDLAASEKHYRNYTLDYQNYYIQFSLMSLIPNAPMISLKVLDKYFTQKFVYYEADGSVINLDYDLCSILKQNIFLESSRDPLNSDTSDINSNTLCVKNPFDLGRYLYGNTIIPNSLIYKIFKCQNSTSNNNSCATDEEIMEMIQFISVQIQLPRTFYDFANVKMPRKRTYDTQVYKLES